MAALLQSLVQVCPAQLLLLAPVGTLSTGNCHSVMHMNLQARHAMPCMHALEVWLTGPVGQKHDQSHAADALFNLMMSSSCNLTSRCPSALMQMRSASETSAGHGVELCDAAVAAPRAASGQCAVQSPGAEPASAGGHGQPVLSSPGAPQLMGLASRPASARRALLCLLARCQLLAQLAMQGSVPLTIKHS